MSTTTKLGLIKPELTDPADITQLNRNWDIIDEELSNGTKIPITSEVPSDADIWIDPDDTTIEENHLTDMSNPHKVTAEQVGAIQMVKLWENTSPTSSFAPQTVQIDLSEYQMVLCQCRLNQTAETLVPSNFIRVGAASGADAYGIVTGYPVRRTITATAEGVKFGEGCKYTTFGSSNVNSSNTVLIPVEIYGLKGVK